MRKNLLIIIGLFWSTYIFGQGELDALRFSQNELTGTARGQAMGGAFGALGGDVTSININPAGIGIYRSSEINGTMGITSTNIKTQWQTSLPDKDNKMQFNFDNISYVSYYPMSDDVVKSVNFGLSYNKVKNFNRNYSAKGNNMRTSLTDFIEALSFGINNEDLYAKGAYEDSDIPWLSILGVDGGLINPMKDKKGEYVSILDVGETVDSRLNVSEKGYIDNYQFTLGTNLAHTVYLGATLTMKDVYYRMDSWYEERFQNKDGFALDNYLQTEGSGFQLNLGAIWRPVDYLRLGIAYHSPTWWTFRDSFQGTLTPIGLKWGNGDKIDQTRTPADLPAEYNLQSPYSWVFSLAGILGKKAIISVDYEIKDYQSMNLEKQNYTNNYFKAQNDSIDRHFKLTSTLRLGMEYRFTPQFSGRLGYAWMQNPYEKSFKNNEIALPAVGTIPHYVIEGDVNYYTVGIGYRFTSNFYIDAAFVYRTQTDDVYFFPQMVTERPDISKGYISYPPIAASSSNNSYKGLITLGYSFK